jgi:Family of unknown function (DUF6600)
VNAKKSVYWILILFFSIAFWNFPFDAADVNVAVGVNTADFGILAQHGQWITVPTYGSVWRPTVTAGWQPFTQGEWNWTDNGWIWNSDEPYGWVVYHYGNWHIQPRLGWVWIPGYEWSPARVQWTTYGSYVGWAPLPPAGIVLPDPWSASRVRYWNVVEVRNFHRGRIQPYLVRTAPLRVNRTAVTWKAPEVREIERVSKRKVDVVHFKTTEVPAGKHKLKKIEFVRSGPVVKEKEKVQAKTTEKQAEGKKAKKHKQKKSKAKEKEKEQQKN